MVSREAQGNQDLQSFVDFPVAPSIPRRMFVERLSTSIVSWVTAPSLCLTPSMLNPAALTYQAEYGQRMEDRPQATSMFGTYAVGVWMYLQWPYHAARFQYFEIQGISLHWADALIAMASLLRLQSRWNFAIRSLMFLVTIVGKFRSR